MKQFIDDLVRSIHHDLAAATPSPPQLALALTLLGLDNLSRAREKRAHIKHLVANLALSKVDRDYAKLQLAALPDF